MQFTAKQLNRQAAKASKEEQTEKAKLKKVSQRQPSGSAIHIPPHAKRRTSTFTAC